MTIIMIVMICVGCAFIIAGLAVVGVYAFRLLKAARAAGFTSADQVATLIRKGQKLGPRIEEFQARQSEMAERFENLSATSKRLSHLKDSLLEASGWSYISKLKS